MYIDGVCYVAVNVNNKLTLTQLGRVHVCMLMGVIGFTIRFIVRMCVHVCVCICDINE